MQYVQQKSAQIHQKAQLQICLEPANLPGALIIIFIFFPLYFLNINTGIYL